MRHWLLCVVVFQGLNFAKAQQPAGLHKLFNTAEELGEPASPEYAPHRMDEYFCTHDDRRMFDLLNEAAVRHDPALKPFLKRHEKELGYVPMLAAAHYAWAFGDQTRLAWLMGEAKRAGLGRDSMILTVFGYMDEWDQTIRWLKENEAYDDKYHNAAPGEVVGAAVEDRKRIYGRVRFEQAWASVKTGPIPKYRHN